VRAREGVDHDAALRVLEREGPSRTSTGTGRSGEAQPAGSAGAALDLGPEVVPRVGEALPRSGGRDDSVEAGKALAPPAASACGCVSTR
jgi:hypothetical protein